jgi:choline dehydrogenase-like flavoprotein
VWIRGRQVGGRSLTWGGVTLRLSDYELRDGEADESGAQWPISYRDLAPSYGIVEQFLGVRGGNDAVSALPDGVFAPALPLTFEESSFKEHVESRWSDRRVLSCRGISGADAAVDGDPRWPPLAVQHRVLPAAMRTGRLTLVADTIVSHLVASPSADRVMAVACIRRATGERYELRGRVTVLCASTLESVRILANSRTASAPNGLSNSSGCLGHCLLDHLATIRVGRIPGKVPAALRPFGGAHGIVIPRFRNCETRHPSYICGFGIWGSMGRAAWPDTGESLWSLCAMLEVLPRAGNRVSLDETQRDCWGVPAVRVDFEYSQNELQMREDAEACMSEMTEGLSWQVEQQIRMLPGQFVHELGGARMGTSPNNSVLNRHNQSWDVPNLFVLDGSCFATSGWQNPTLTIMALAVRACGFIEARIRSNEFQ